jgi:hypothetical protein
VAALFFALLTAALMGPVLVHFNDWLYGIGHDGIGAPAELARRLLADQVSGPLGSGSTLIGAPFPYPSTGAAADPLWWNIGTAFAHILSPVGATNALIFISFVGTAAAAYILLRWQRLPAAPATLGALIYGFCPARLAQAQEHFLLLDGFWLVIESGCLLALIAHKRNLWAIALGVCIGLTELDNPYLGYFGGILAASWFTFIGISGVVQRDWIALWATFRYALLAVAVTAMMVIPTQLSLLLLPTSTSQPADSEGSLVRTIGDVDRLSLRWWDFLLPYPQNPILGPLGKNVFDAHLGVDTVTEQSTMTGYVALVLAITGVFLLLRGRGKIQLRQLRGPPSSATIPVSLFRLAVVCIVAGALFGLPPEFVFGTVHVPTPSYFVHAVLPEIRTTSRIDLLIQLGIAILASLGAWLILSAIRTPGRRALTTASLIALVLLEYTNVPPWRSVALLPAPALDQWLATLSDQQAGIVVQYPISSFDLARTPLYTFYAYAVHHHRIFNGVLKGTPADALRRNLEDLLNPTDPASWAALGVRTVTVDSTYFGPYFGNAGLQWSSGGIGQIQRLPRGLIQRYGDAQSSAYAVVSDPAAVVAGIGDGFGDAQLQPDGREWHWIGDHATVWLDNVTDRSVSVVLWSLAHNNRSAHSLVWPGYAPIPVSVSLSDNAVALATTAVPGTHPLVLAVTGPNVPLEGSNDSTSVSVMLRTLEPAPVRPINASFVQAGSVRVVLSAVSTDVCAVQAGTALHVALLWNERQPTIDEQTVFLHLISSAGLLVAQDDGLPDAGTVTTSGLSSGMQIIDVHTLKLPSTLPPGNYQMEAGLYNAGTLTRLPRATGGDAVRLGAITIEPVGPGPLIEPCAWPGSSK